jgi:hypothetical protein
MVTPQPKLTEQGAGGKTNPKSHAKELARLKAR